MHVEHSLPQPYTQISTMITLCIAASFPVSAGDGRCQYVSEQYTQPSDKNICQMTANNSLNFYFYGGRRLCRHMLYLEKYPVLTRTYVLARVVLLAAVLASVEAR